MNVTCVVALSICVIAASAAPTLAQSSFTGTNWRGWHSDTKLLYVVGFIDGRQHGLFTATKEFAPALIPKWSTDPRIAKFASSVTAGQLVEGMNKFYEDFRNLQIGIRSALTIVDDEASGARRWTEDDLVRIRAAEARPRVPDP